MSKFFNDSELACKCCGSLPDNGIDSRLFDLLDEMREYFGVPMYITSGYRCPAHNAEVGGVPNSQHVMGIAADIDATVLGVDLIAEIAEQYGADGVGKYYASQFVHVDVRSGKIGDTFRWEG